MHALKHLSSLCFFFSPFFCFVFRTEDELVDVDGEETSPPALYDVSKARAMMSDCDRHASLLRPDVSDSKEDWEDHFASVR